ncbi:MAG: TRAP transporter permease [Bradyrhizobiaceae bacterium]|nr:TRAP transporter permease [Bradyrhizobiaceae bacterium]
MPAQIVFWVAILWSLFQLWYASPLPFIVGFFVFNDTEARAIHLGFALFLAYTAYPAFRSSPRRRIPIADWVLALAGAFAGSYLFLFYNEIALRPGQPNTMDLVISGAGILLLLEATRRSLGLPMVFVAGSFIFFTFAGPYMPEALQHKGTSVSRFLTHQWLVTEGVFGVALGVSTSFVFLFVLFGTLLEKAGGGNWMMQLSIALLGHLRGGAAKVAVVSSAMNGIVSGSSVSNVVTGGIFTIPMMKRSGLSGVKAGAIEASSSINGQIVPPVMGAAAFLMVEYVGIPYVEIIKHAALPAVISYVALFYIVHLEAVKAGAQPIERQTRPLKTRLLRAGLGISGTIAVICGLYYGIEAVRATAGAATPWILTIGGLAIYLWTLWYAARHPDLAVDDPNAPIIHLPLTWDVVRTGIDFLIPIGVLLWCLTIEMMSPGLSAFWATVTILGIVATRKPLVAMFRGQAIPAATSEAVYDLFDGLALGARNMIGIAVATATAGIVVGTVTLTGLGLMMTEFVEFVSGGNVLVMLLMVAVISLILGLGIPTTANYILVATLMAPVVVELGAQAGLAIPLIAVHMFVFYFGIMADITPPVGLAAFAAAAISREDPLATGAQGAVYSLRTAILPFVFIFNPELLLIDIQGWLHGIWVVFISTIAILLFAAASMNWFITRSRIWESVVLLLCCFALFRPAFFLDFFYPPTVELPATQLLEKVAQTPANQRIAIVVEGTNIEGERVRKTVSLPLGDPQEPRLRLRAVGLGVTPMGDKVTITNVAFGSYARRIGLDVGYEVVGVLQPAERPSRAIPAAIALLVTAGIAALQYRRRRAATAMKEAPV